MTMTPEAPAMPAWLNVELLAPDDLRAEAAELERIIRAAHAQIAGVHDRIKTVFDRTEAAYRSARDQLVPVVGEERASELSDGLAILVEIVTGQHDLWQACADLAAEVEPDNIAMERLSATEGDGE